MTGEMVGAAGAERQLAAAALVGRFRAALRLHPYTGTRYARFFADSEVEMRRVTGIGGIFFTAKDPKALCAWYKKHLGIDVQDWGGAAFTWTDAAGNPAKGTTVWSIGAAHGNQFAPSKSDFMVNYRVEDLAALLQALREEGCEVLEKTDDSEYGKFGWVMDPEGNKLELWQPPAAQ